MLLSRVVADPVFVPDELPCPPVLTCRGWFYFDTWGREVKLKPQPERPTSNAVPVRKLCSYFKLRQKFLYLPEQMMKTDQARKKAIAEQKKQAKIFFLPFKEKQQHMRRELSEKLEAKKSKKQKAEEKASGEAFASEFGRFVTRKVCVCKSVTLTCLMCNCEPCLCGYDSRCGVITMGDKPQPQQERLCDKCGAFLSCQECKCEPCLCDFDEPLEWTSKGKENNGGGVMPREERELLEAAAKKEHIEESESESEQEWDGEDDLVVLDSQKPV